MSEVFEKAVAELNLDRSDWQLVKFGDVAIQQKQSVDRENTELTRYVKGEHMYSEDIHLREWGELTDEYLGPAFIRKFEEGDILYGSRRTYLRKVVIAPFEGITSNTTFVIKANEEKIDKRLLPFIMLSEGFSQHSIKNSKGSVNPYVNWKDLAGYEFLLPDPSAQKQIAELLFEKNIHSESSNYLLEKLKISKESMIKDYISKSTKNKKVRDLGIVLTGSTPSTSVDDYWGGQIPFITPADIDDSPTVIEPERFVTESGLAKSRKFPKDSVMTVCIGSTIGKVGLSIEESCCNQQINVLIPKEEYGSVYLLYLFRFFKHKILARTGATAVPIINKSEFELISFPILENELISAFESDVMKFDNAIVELKSKITSDRLLQKSIINQVF